MPALSPLATSLPLGLYWFREGASNFAADIDAVYWFIFWLSVVFFVIIVGVMALFTLKYRARPGHVEQPSADHNMRLEMVWTILPIFLVALLFFLGFVGFLEMANPPDDSYEVRVRAKKWAWSFEYPGGLSWPDLHVWKGHPIKLVQQSDDVLHSLYVPAFRIKMDCVPGRYTYQWFQVNELPSADDVDNVDNKGRLATGGDQEVGYDLFCTEYCGTGHSNMFAKVVVHETKADFDKWYEIADNDYEKNGVKVPLEEVGAAIYSRKGCAQCHSTDGKPGTGPTFKGSFGTDRKLASGETVKMDENYIRESVLNPQAKVVSGYNPVMPTFQGQLRDTADRPDIDALIAFIKSLKE